MKSGMLEIITTNDPETIKKLINAVLKQVIDFTSIVVHKSNLAAIVERANK